MNQVEENVVLSKISKFREYLDYIERHYNNVQKAWKLINEKCENDKFKFIHDDFLWHAINQDVESHDLSKLSEHEFTQYRQYFFPTKCENKDRDLFLKAWEHHRCNNLHHWQSWTTKENKTPYDEAFVIMMLVDWIAMSFEFNDTALSYYEKNKNEIILPQWAIELMYGVFDAIY